MLACSNPYFAVSLAAASPAAPSESFSVLGLPDTFLLLLLCRLLVADFSWASSILKRCHISLPLLIYTTARLPSSPNWQLLLLMMPLLSPISSMNALPLDAPRCACLLRIINLSEASPQVHFTVWSADGVYSQEYMIAGMTNEQRSRRSSAPDLG